MRRHALRTSALLLVGLLAVGCGTPWEAAPDPRPDPGHAGEVETRLDWVRWPAGSQGGQGYGLDPELGGDRIFVADARGWVRALDRERGATLWHRRMGRSLSGGPSHFDNGMVVVGDRKGYVIALEADSGETRWEARVSSEVMASPRMARGVLIVRSSDGRLYGLDPDNGERRWVYERSNPPLTLRGDGVPAISGGSVIAGWSSGRLVRLSAETGEVQWDREIHEPRGATDLERMADVVALPSIARGTVYAAAYQGSVVAARVGSGEIQWQRSIGSHYGLTVHGDLVVVAADDGAVWALDRDNGATAWRQEALRGLRLTRPVAVTNEHVVIADGEGHVNWLRRRDGALVAREAFSGFGFHRAALVDHEARRLLLIDERGRLYAVGYRQGEG